MSGAGLPEFDAHLASAGLAPPRRGAVRVLQVNLGRLCNLACHHCHVEAGPNRTENLDARAADRVLGLLERSPGIETLDLTGGAPELNPHFRRLVEGARALGRRVVDRCNLTVLFEPGQETTAEFLAEQGVDVVASLPCYTAERVEAQRGRGVFDRSIEALRWLNRLGYGQPGSSLRLDLVYNPVGPDLPPSQDELEKRYREELRRLFGIEFDHLITITNMPIRRFERALVREGRLGDYLDLLVSSFNAATLPALMCRETLSVSWDGRIYDCDFNQMAGLPMPGTERTLWDLESVEDLEGCGITTASHCFGCTAGAGSSCGGRLVG